MVLVFLLGSTLIILIAALLGMVTAEGFLLTRADPGPIKSWIDLLLGIIVLYYGFKILLKKNAWFEEKELELPTNNKSATSEFLSSLFLAMGLFALNFITTALVFLGGSNSGSWFRMVGYHNFVIGFNDYYSVYDSFACFNILFNSSKSK